MKHTCNTCKEEKEISEFYPKGIKYFTKSCKKCLREKQKTYPQSSKEYFTDYYRNIERFKKYHITKKEYDKLYKDQNGRCAICRTPEKDLKKALNIDHCHKTEKVRGLLCNSCNQGLGYFKDNISTLEDALYYLILNKT